MTIGDKFDEIANTYPDNDALIVLHQNVHWSYRELQQRANQCARALLSMGVRKGDRVGVWSPNCSEWTVSQIATAKNRCDPRQRQPGPTRTHELEYALNQSGASFPDHR